MHSGKLNWTELNWTELDRSVQFSSVQFPVVHWTGDELRPPATSHVPNCQECATAVAGRRWFSAQWKTELNWTERSSSVQFSSVQSSSVQFSFTLCIGLNRRAFVDNMSNSDIQLIIIIIIIIFFIINWVISNNRVSTSRTQNGRQPEKLELIELEAYCKDWNKTL